MGIMESDNQHLYGARMDSVPCAWLIEGGSDMARVISGRASGRKVPRMTGERSMPQAKREAQEKKMLAHFARGCAGRMVESVRKGYLPSHQMDARRLDGGKAYALYRGMSNMDLGI